MSFRFIGSGEPWNGEPLGGYKYHAKTLDKKTDGELEDLGLERTPVPDPVTPEPEPDTRTLDQIKNDLIWRLTDNAEGIRLQFITSGFGKSLSYGQGLREAQAVVSDTAAALAFQNEDAVDSFYQNACEEKFPVLYPDIAQFGLANIVEAAENVLLKQKSFAKIENILKKTIDSGRKAITAAASADEAVAAFESVVWPSFS